MNSLNIDSCSNRLDIRQFLVLLYDCIPNMKYLCSIDRLLKNANILKSGSGKNLFLI